MRSLCLSLLIMAAGMAVVCGGPNATTASAAAHDVTIGDEETAALLPWLSNTTAQQRQRQRRRRLQQSREPGQRISEYETAAENLRRGVSKLFDGATEKDFLADVKWYDAAQAGTKLVERLLRALMLQDKFVIVVGGMSDTAGHGNKAAEAYPMVMKAALEPVFEAAGVQLVVRNLAMGGVPSFPNSLCMNDAFGADADLVIWDFRMVEHDDLKGELYLRQALMMPRAPAVMFKRPLRYLPAVAPPYASMSSLHVIDETPLHAKLLASKASGLTGDSFCAQKCSCPGQVRWHAGWKTHRMRGLQMAVVYSHLLGKAIDQFKDVLRTSPEQAANLGPQSPLVPKLPGLGLPPLPLPKPKHKSLAGQPFAVTPFKCGLSWSPRGPSSVDLVKMVDTSEAAKGGTKWKVRDPNARISSQGKKCGYTDDKAELEGNVNDGWVFFPLKDVGPMSTAYANGGGGDSSGKAIVGFCADFPKPKEARLKDFEVLVLVNGEEAQADMEFWMDARTLGVSIQCYGTSKFVRPGAENVLGFRVMQNGMTFKLTHVIWT